MSDHPEDRFSHNETHMIHTIVIKCIGFSISHAYFRNTYCIAECFTQTLSFNSTSRYLDDLLNIDNIHFERMVQRIYPTELGTMNLSKHM